MRPIILNRTVLLSLALFGACAHAHDFWVEPNSYEVAEAAPVGSLCRLGMAPFARDRQCRCGESSGSAWVAPDSTIADLRGSLRLGAPDADAQLVFSQPGTFIVALETDNRAQSHLPSLRFNDYLRVEGLAAALQQRERTHRMDADGSEIYSRHSKALIQVGSSSDHSARVTQPLGMPLEIVPDINPYECPWQRHCRFMCSLRQGLWRAHW